MISELEIENFKGIPRIKLTELKQFNILIGKNNSGKSTILESIFTLRAVSDDRQAMLRRIARGNFREQHAIELWHNRQPTNNPVIKLKIHETDFIVTFASDATFSDYLVRLQIGDKGGITFNTNNFLNDIRNLQNGDFFKGLESHFNEIIFNMQLINDFLIRASNTWEPLIDPSSVVDDYEQVPQPLKFTDYLRDQKRLAIRKNGRDFFTDTLGDGNRSGLALLGIIKKLKNTIILVEEIENHHHPSSLSELIPKFIKICEENNIQAFVTTHSPLILQMFSNIENTKFYHLKKTEEEISVKQIQFNDMSMMMDIGWDITKLLEYEKNVLVEGPIDEAIFRNVFFKIRNYWPEKGGILIQSVGGISKQKEILKILAHGDRTIFAETDKDDRTIQEIQNSLFGPFKHDLLRDGYTLEQDDEIIQLKKDKSVKKFPRKNLIITGLPEKFPGLKKHTTDDYLLEIFRQEPELLENMPDRIPNSTLSFNGENSKERLQQVFVEYGPLKASQIIQKCKIESIPRELIDIIEKISS